MHVRYTLLLWPYYLKDVSTAVKAQHILGMVTRIDAENDIGQ